MSERSGWASPDSWGRPAETAAPAPDAPPPHAPGPPAAGSPPGPQAPASQAPGWQAPPGWGGEQSGPPPYGGWGAPRPPEVKPGVVPLRPLGLGEILDGAVGILRRYPRPALGLSALVALVTTLLNLVLVLTAFQPFLDLDPATLESGSTEDLEGALGGVAAGSGATALVSLVANVVLTGVITAVVGKAVLGQPLTIGQAWQQVRPRLLPLLGLAVLVPLIVGAVVVAGVAVAVALVALGGGWLAVVAVPLGLAAVLAGVFLYVRLSLAASALVLERVGVRASMRRSSLLVKRDWWRVFGILLLTLVISQSVSAILQLPFQASAGLPGFGGFEEVSTGELIVSSIGSAIALTLVAPFTAGVRALLYVDRRMRAEGLDVQLAASAGAPPAPGA
jgi:hypothetical protein